MSVMISIGQARELVLAAVNPLEAESVSLGEALGRVLARDVVATGDVPPFPNSAMDGYAVLSGPAGRTLKVVGESRAGTPTTATLRDGEAIRISTGAVLPSGATAVIPQENVGTEADRAITTRADVADGDNVRQPGEDMAAGTIVLPAGTRLGPVALGAAVSAGAAEVTAARRPRVAVLCTGDELRAPGEPLAPGQIHNSNAPMLAGLALHAGAVVASTERLPDDRAATESGVRAALARADVVIISGGVSVGPHDHVKPVLASLGVGEVFWGVALQPGKPTWFGTAPDGTLVFALPGNPVSTVVTFSLFAAPALAALQGGPPPSPPCPQAALAVPVARRAGREQAVRVRLEHRDGRVWAQPTGAQGSHILSSLLRADALAMIPAGDGALPAGGTVSLEALAG